MELPITRQFAAILKRRSVDGAVPAMWQDGWVFLSRRSGAGHVADIARFYGEINDKGGARLWIHGLRKAFIMVAERELMLPRSLTKRLVDHAPPSGRNRGLCHRLERRAASRTRASHRRSLR